MRVDEQEELRALRAEHEALRKDVEKLCQAISRYPFEVLRPTARDIAVSIAKRKRDDGRATS